MYRVIYYYVLKLLYDKMERMLTTIIIDDDHIATEQLKKEVCRYSRLHFLGSVCDGAMGRRLIVNNNPDIVFLDVELPDCTGFEFFRSVKGILKPNCHVVFYTAYNKYMIEALREKAFDFLLKPLDPQDFSKVVSRVLSDYSDEVVSDNNNDSIILNSVIGDIIVVKIDDISYFSYDESRRCWTSVLCDGKSYVLRRTTKSDKILSYSNAFFQVGKPHIINKHKLAQVKDGHCIMQAPLDHVHNIMISNAKLNELRNSFTNL